MNFILAMQSSIQGNLSAYVTSEFDAHGLLATIGIVSTISVVSLRLRLPRSSTSGAVLRVSASCCCS